MLGATNINYVIDIQTSLEPIVKNITARKNILLIIKEATNNCLKYSKASEYRITTSFNENELQICITDNGTGIPPEKINIGNGLKNMQKRTEELKGKINIETAGNKGTQLIFTFPYTNIRK